MKYKLMAILAVGLLAGPLAAQATIITKAIWGTRGLSGTFAYDDNLITAGSGDYTEWTFAAITSFSATLGWPGNINMFYPAPFVTSWDIADYLNSPFLLFLATDPVGRVGLFSVDSTGENVGGALFSNQQYGLELNGCLVGGSPWRIGCLIWELHPTPSTYVPGSEGFEPHGAYTIAAVSEPSELSLLFLGFAVMGITRRRKKT